jgi:hypothetical protein
LRDGRKFCHPPICDAIIPNGVPLLKCLCLGALAKCHNGGLPFADGDGHVGNDAMTIPDYLAIGLLLMMVLGAARWFAQRKFEL